MTTSQLNVLGIAGSLRKDSFNRALLRAAQELAPDGVRITVFERLREIPPYDADADAKGDPESVTDLKRAIADAGALLIATPEYNYGVPGVLKNAIDWASRPPRTSVLKGKPAAIMGASAGLVGTARAQLQLRHAFLFTETYPLVKPEILVASASQKFDDEGRLTDETARKLIRQQLEALVDWAKLFG